MNIRVYLLWNWLCNAGGVSSPVYLWTAICVFFAASSQTERANTPGFVAQSLPTIAYKRSTNSISFRCFSFISIRREWVHMDKYGPLIEPVISPAALWVPLTGEELGGWAAATTRQSSLCILTAARLRCLVFAETADDLPCSPCPLLNRGRIDLIASLAKGPARSRPLPHCSMSRVQPRGKVNRVNSISLS